MLTTVPPGHVGTETFERLRASVVRQRIVTGREGILTGERSACLHLMVSGVAAHYRMLGNGRRQITALVLPGDFCDLADHVGGRPSQVVALTPCQIGEVPHEALFDGRAPQRVWTDFVMRTLAREESIAAEWIVSLGHRSAYEAAAHLFCELWERLEAVGLIDGQSFAFGLTQLELSDVLGMTSIHINRTLRAIREDGLVTVGGRLVTILDHAALVRAADFDPAYLLLNDPAHKPSKGHVRKTGSSHQAFVREAAQLGSSSVR